jgi:hypothetical protein
MTTVLVATADKLPEEIKDYVIDWSAESYRFWNYATEYNAGTKVRPSLANGFEYSASATGQTSGKKEPTWPTTVGDTVTDGSITWTCTSITTDGLLRHVSASTWTCDDASISMTGSQLLNTAGSQRTYIQVGGGVSGNVVDVLNTVTFSDGVKLDAILRITIDDEASL